MKTAQIYGPIFYNWLCGTINAFANSDNPYARDFRVAKERQDGVHQDPLLGHLVGFIFSQDKRNKYIGQLNDIFSNKDYKKEIIGIIFIELGIKSTDLTPQILSPRFWINHTDLLGKIASNVSAVKDSDLSKTLSAVYHAADTMKRQSYSRQKLVPGGVL